MSDTLRFRRLGRLGGLALHAKGDSHRIAARARAGIMRRFEREVDPRNELAPEERHRRARIAHRAHMTRISMKAAEARQRRASSPVM